MVFLVHQAIEPVFIFFLFSTTFSFVVCGELMFFFLILHPTGADEVWTYKLPNIVPAFYRKRYHFQVTSSDFVNASIKQSFVLASETSLTKSTP